MIQENEDPGDSGGADIQATEGQGSKYPRGRNWAAKVAYSAEVPKCVSTCETGRAQKAINGECPGGRSRIPVSQRKRNLKHTEDRRRKAQMPGIDLPHQAGEQPEECRGPPGDLYLRVCNRRKVVQGQMQAASETGKPREGGTGAKAQGANASPKGRWETYTPKQRAETVGKAVTAGHSSKPPPSLGSNPIDPGRACCKHPHQHVLNRRTRESMSREKQRKTKAPTIPLYQKNWGRTEAKGEGTSKNMLQGESGNQNSCLRKPRPATSQPTRGERTSQVKKAPESKTEAIKSTANGST